MSLPTDNGDAGGSTGGSTGGGEFLHRLEWQMLSWDDLTPAQQTEARRRNSIECKVGHLQDNAAITRKSRTRGDIVSVEDLIPLIAEMWAKEDGFTIAARKGVDGKVKHPPFAEGIAAAIQYTEQDLMSMPSPEADVDDFLEQPVLVVRGWLVRHDKALEETNAMVGGYFNKIEEIFEISISMVFYSDRAAAARRFCEDGNQISGWDFAANGGEGGEVETGGSGRHPKPTSGW